jgi:membrane protein DedA with SNARE-associated domain
VTDWLLAGLVTTGVPLLFLTTYLSCLMVPVPSSLVMLAGGAFAAGGDLSLFSVTLAAYLGAVLGDQTGFVASRMFAGRIDRVMTAREATARMIAAARTRLERSGGMTVFLTRWLMSPLGPYVNLAAGATGFGWLRFSLASAAGEAVWVTLYTGLGWSFASYIDMIADLSGNITAGLAAAMVAVLLGRHLLTITRQRHRHDRNRVT